MKMLFELLAKIINREKSRFQRDLRNGFAGVLQKFYAFIQANGIEIFKNIDFRELFETSAEIRRRYIDIFR